MPSSAFSLLHETYAVARLGAREPLPPWAHASSGFMSITRTKEELSIVCRGSAVPSDARAEHDWRGVKLHGPFAFDQVGVLSSFVSPLAASRIGVFAVSTFDTDYVFVKQADLDRALSALAAAGHALVAGDSPE